MLRFALVLGLIATTAARADDLATYEANGDASAVAGADGRVEALDDAFARAAGQALEDLVPADVRTAHKADLDREIVGHARLWVAKFTVTKDETNDQRRQLTVSVRVDREKMRARLIELNLVTAATPVAGQHAVAILLRVAAPGGNHATYGAAAEKDVAGLAGASATLRTAGYATKRAPASGAAVAGPLGDDEAEAIAGDAKADFALVASVTVGGPVPLRGAAPTMSLVSAHVKLVERGTHKASEGDAVLAAGADVDRTIERALAAALADVLPPQARSIAQAGGFHGDDVPVGEPGVVLVRLAAKTPYALVLAEQKHLQGVKGVTRATLRRIGPGGWVIGVATSEPADRIASAARKPPAAGTTASARQTGDIVEVALAGATP